MNTDELEQLSEEYTTILENVETVLTLVEESLKEVRCNTADAEQLLARLLSMRILSHNYDAEIAKAGELLTLRPISSASRPLTYCTAYVRFRNLAV